MLRSRRFWLSLLFVLFAIASLNAFAASRLRRWSVKSPFVVRHAAGAYLQRPAAPLWPLEQSKPEGHGTPAVALPTQPDPQSPDALSIGREAEVGGVPPLPFFADSTLSASVWHKLRPSLSYFKWLKEDPTPFNSWPGGRTGTTPARIHWKKLPERYPVPQKSLISLPSAQPRSLPRIQHAASSPETAADKKERERRKAAVKEAFVHSWKGYKAYAWLDDELLPVSGQSQSPFCGWAATLVDSLDTMWIMGMKAEFEHAVKALDKIDFTTSLAEEIPLFETTIRYFGGLLSAYDVSNAQYPILLRKAVELANVLLAAFDTPNRMPMTFYRWKP
jgi:mannosyl-oligosaccharide alpha-1,2-mannosidase